MTEPLSKARLRLWLKLLKTSRLVEDEVRRRLDGRDIEQLAPVRTRWNIRAVIMVMRMMFGVIVFTLIDHVIRDLVRVVIVRRRRVRVIWRDTRAAALTCGGDEHRQRGCRRQQPSMRSRHYAVAATATPSAWAIAEPSSAGLSAT